MSANKRLNRSEPPVSRSLDSSIATEVPFVDASASIKAWVLTAAAVHLLIVAFCLASADRQSELATDMLGGLSPYAVTLNLRHEAHPLAVVDEQLFDRPIAVTFNRSASPTSAAQTAAQADAGVRWIDASRTDDGGGLSHVRRQRYLAQLTTLVEVESEAGVTLLIEAMRRDLATQAATPPLDRVLIERARIPMGDSNPNLGSPSVESPSAEQSEIILDADLVELDGGRLGILPQVEPLRTAPVEAPAATTQTR